MTPLVTSASRNWSVLLASDGRRAQGPAKSATKCIRISVSGYMWVA